MFSVHMQENIDFLYFHLFVYNLKHYGMPLYLCIL